MEEPDIICKPTADTFVRFGIVLAAFFGFGLYFFYDGAIGYRKENSAICSYQRFAELGSKASALADEYKDSPALARSIWAQEYGQKPLLELREENGESLLRLQDEDYAVLTDNGQSQTKVEDIADFAAFSKSWSDCWANYSKKMHYPITPGEHPHGMGAIREQWIAGSACMLISAFILYLMLRTKRRVLSLCGDTVCAAGQSFKIQDIQRIDLRQWGKGFKGQATFTVGGKKLRVDGMTYGGFNPSKGEPAEMFMKALLSRYQGELVEYEQKQDN